MVNHKRKFFAIYHLHPITKRMKYILMDSRKRSKPSLVLVYPIVQKVNVLNTDNYLMLHEYQHLKYPRMPMEECLCALPFSPPVSFDRHRLISISIRSANVTNSARESVVRTTRRKFSIVNGIC